MKIVKGLLFVVVVLAGLAGLNYMFMESVWSSILSSQPGPQTVSQKAFVAKVVVNYPRRQDVSTGTLIRNDLVLTCYHAIKERYRSGTITVEFVDGYTTEARVIKIDPLRDLALLRIKPVLFPCAKAALIPAVKDDVITICGFQYAKTYAEVTGELVGHRSPFPDDPNKLFLVNNKCYVGMPGGPALDSNGDMVGMLFGSFAYSNCIDLVVIKNFLASVR